MKGREYPRYPMVGVGAVVFNDENKTLLIRRSQEPSQGLWALPGGLLEVGEELKAAVKREVKEECNIDVDVGEVVGVLDLILRDQDENVKYHYVLIDYYAKYISGNLSPQSDAQEANWFSQQEIDQLNVPEATKQVIIKVFKRLENN